MWDSCGQLDWWADRFGGSSYSVELRVGQLTTTPQLKFQVCISRQNGFHINKYASIIVAQVERVTKLERLIKIVLLTDMPRAELR